MERLSSNIKKNSGNGNPKKASYIQGNGTCLVHPQKISYISGNGSPEKILIFQEMELIHISGNETFLYFRKRNFFIFRERHI